MDSLGPLGEDLSNDEIVQRCRDPRRELLGTTGRIVRLSDKTVVKFGWGVTTEEADNQKRAFELLDNSIVRVPEVYRYFSRSNAKGDPESGYLVMEYIHVEVLDEKDSLSKERIEQIAQILHHFSTIRGDCPGPLGGGISRGLLWEDNGKPVFKNVQQMERWLNHRLPDVESKLSIQNYPLILCHLDLAPRNVVWLPDGSVCFLDWCSAGFYPRFFEVAMLRIMEYAHGNYELDLIERIAKLTEEEETQMRLLQRSFYNGIKYLFANIHETLE